MSFRGGRGGGSAGGFQRNLPFGLDYQDVNKPQEAEKPSILLPVNGPSSKQEQIISSHYINSVITLRDGPFFTGDTLENVSIEKDKETQKQQQLMEDDGIQDGLKRYSDKYIKKRKIGPSIDDHPYRIQFFPQELYKAMGVDDKRKKKLLALSQLQSSKEVLANKDILLAKLKEVGDDDDKAQENNDGEDGDKQKEVEENWDDEFEDEDDDDDYNAEKYFDDGEEFGDEDDYNDEAAF